MYSLSELNAKIIEYFKYLHVETDKKCLKIIQWLLKKKSNNQFKIAGLYEMKPRKISSLFPPLMRYSNQ